MVEHRHPLDELNAHFDTHTVHPLSRLHVMTIVAAEQQTMNFYMNHATDYMEPIVRGLYNEIAMIEEQHVTHYESLLDPLDSWIKMWVFHEYNEVYLYWSMAQQETDPRIKALWERHCEMEIGQLQVAAAALERFEGVAAAELLPRELPDIALTFEPNKAYVRQVLAEQVDLRKNGIDYVDLAQLGPDHRYFDYQRALETSKAPSELVIEQTRRGRGAEYRDETDGPHPVVDLRAPAGVR
jgi:hypothetical protein